MRIDRLLQGSAVLAITSVMVVAGSVGFGQVLDARRTAITQNMTEAVRKISVVRGSLAELTSDDRSRAAAQWHLELAQLAQIVNGLEPVDPTTRALKTRIVQEEAAVGALLSRLEASRFGVDASMISGQLDVRTASMLADVLAFNSATGSSIERQKNWALTSMGASILVLAAVIVGLIKVLQRRVAAPIGQLEQASALMGAGELDQPVVISGTEEVTSLARSFDAMRLALKKRDRRRDEFLAMLSHELRNPLAPIRNAVGVLEIADPNSAHARRAKDVIKRQMAHLSRIVDDLLDVTRVARGKIELRREPVDLAELVTELVDDHRMIADEHGLLLGMHLPAGPVWVHADAPRIVQVMTNLVQNAIRFTPPGGNVDVVLTTHEHTADIRVSDTGAGIEEKLLHDIFEPFTQGEQSIARTKGGLGLGLPIVKGLTELHEGTVTAQSAGPGKGATFSVRLPMIAGRVDAVASVQRDGRQARRGVVLIVEDNLDAAESLADLVSLHGHGTDVAFDGLTALQKIAANQPDLVLCDIGLPGMDGYELARTVRGKGMRIPLVAVSGYARPEDVRKAQEAGFDGHIAKPPDPRRIAQLLGTISAGDKRASAG